MRPFIFTLLTVILSACSLKQPVNTVDSKTAQGNVVITKAEKGNHSLVDDSCFKKLYVDRQTVETKAYRQFWSSAQKLGYTFNDDTTVPFVKIIFKPKASLFYTDTLKISDCNIFDSVNIHSMTIHSSKPVERNYYPNLVIEEWQFKSEAAALKYANALSEYHRKGYGLKSPTAVVVHHQAVYLFETAAYMFIPAMERMEKLLGPGAKLYGTNY